MSGNLVVDWVNNVLSVAEKCYDSVNVAKKDEAFMEILGMSDAVLKSIGYNGRYWIIKYKRFFDVMSGKDVTVLIGVDDGDIILNLSLTIPKVIKKLDESKVVGVDLGIAIPAMCALNTNSYSRKSIGSADDFLRVRTKIRAQRRRLQKSLSQTSSGHGRNKKLRALDKFSKYEKHWVQNYNHYVSKQVVDFAIKNNAKYINFEDLEGYGEEEKNKFILSNWSYYQLQQYITYKAEKYGIEVRKINPYHTSQVCSCCGHWEEGQRINQKTFICKNPECKNYGEEINADFNAARNIALSTDWSEVKKLKAKKNKKK